MRHSSQNNICAALRQCKWFLSRLLVEAASRNHYFFYSPLLGYLVEYCGDLKLVLDLRAFDLRAIFCLLHRNITLLHANSQNLVSLRYTFKKGKKFARRFEPQPLDLERQESAIELRCFAEENGVLKPI